MSTLRKDLITAFVLIVVLSPSFGILATPPAYNASMSVGWGFEVGRANETDVEALLADQLAVKRSLAWIKQVISQDLGKERALATLVASKPGEPIADILEKGKKYWEIEVETPLKRIAKNPAASCAEAEWVFQQYLGLERQRALWVGGDEESLRNLFVSEIYSDSQTRCRQEALDECNATGGYEHIFKMALGEERQSASLGFAADTSWVKKVLAECANYELHYVSTTNISDQFKLHSVIDGRIKVKPRLEGENVIQILANFSLEGEVMSGANPFLVKITCSAPVVTMTCSPGGEPKRSAKARIAKLTLKSKEFYLENEQSKQRPAGEDLLELIFAPAMLSSVAVVRVPEVPPQTIPFVEVGATGFDIAHNKVKVEPPLYEFSVYRFIETKRTGYPILFEFTRADSDTVEVAASDSTVFQLIHKPEKQPFPGKDKGPTRTPLRPKPAAVPRTTRPGSPQ